jgi:tripartite-type tricarboxylate transporter receptor subunit TctC
MWKSLIRSFCIVVLIAPGIAAKADSVGDFYKGKTIVLSVGYSPGGAYDAVARLFAQYMPK